MNHLITGSELAIKNKHNTFSYSNSQSKDQTWFHQEYAKALGARLEHYRNGGEIKNLP